MKPVGLLWPSEVVPLGLSPWLFVAWVVPLVLALALVPPIVGSTGKQLVASGWGLYMNGGTRQCLKGSSGMDGSTGNRWPGAHGLECVCVALCLYMFLFVCFPHYTQTP